VRLSGTLYAPAGRKASAAVVVLHGASSPLRDLPLYAHLRTSLPATGGRARSALTGRETTAV